MASGSGRRRPDPSGHPFWRVVSGEDPLPPASKMLGWQFLEGEPGSGHMRVRFELSAEFANPLGTIQGGFLTAMLDDTMSPALATLLAANEMAPTLEIKVSFIRPARPGAFICEARVVHRGRSVGFVEGSLRDEEGRLVAGATATAAIVTVGG